VTQRWQHPIMGEIIFTDRRPKAATVETDLVGFPFTAEDVAGHEARHAAAGLLLGMRVVEARADIPDHKSAGRVLFNGKDADTRDLMVMLLVGPMGDKSVEHWPPTWPLSPHAHGDEGDLARLAEKIALTEHGYGLVCDDARRLTADAEFKSLEGHLAGLLEHMVVLTEPMLNDMRDMVVREREHISFKSVATTTDTGAFDAVISSESVDRHRDIVSAAGMVEALHKWTRPIPLSWNHDLNAENIIGYVDGISARKVNTEVVVSGRVDLNSAVGREAWRSFKSGVLGFSYGYLATRSTKRDLDGGKYITGLDIYEVTATPAPANPDTRVLLTKAIEEDPEGERDENGLLTDAAISLVIARMNGAPATAASNGHTPIGDEAESTKSMQEVISQLFEDVLSRPPRSQPDDDLRKRALAIAAEFSPRPTHNRLEGAGGGKIS
jgi:HK97 family phage prohead protease